MRDRFTVSFTGRSIGTCVLCAIALGLLVATALATDLEQPGHTREESPLTPQNYGALKPIVLIAGGTGYVDRAMGKSPGVLNSAEIYDPALRRFMPIAPMNERRDQFTAAAISIDKVLLVGGINTLLVPLNVFPGPAMPWILRSTEVFNSGDGKFVAAPSMKSSRDEPTVTPLENGKLLIVGGDSPSAEIYDPASNTFSDTGAMASSRHGQTATLLRGGRVLIAGGGVQKLEVYDPAGGKFNIEGQLSNNRLYHTATLLDDGRVLIAGGCPFARSSALDTSEIFDESNQSVVDGPKMTQSRAGHTATLLNDGSVLIAGGRGDKSSELYDPQSGQFIEGPEMVEARSGHSATLLPDGTVLIAGGWDPDYKPLASAEIFDPVADRFVTTGDMTEARAGQSATLILARDPIAWIQPTPSATPTPSNTPTDTLTPTPSITPTKSPTPTITPTPTADAASTPSAKEPSNRGQCLSLKFHCDNRVVSQFEVRG